ncbi:hypothetical protein ACSBR2_015149 [Camellia fascicularis]
MAAERVSTSNPKKMSSISKAKFDVEKFDGNNNFGMWQCEAMDVLYQQELDVTMGNKPSNMNEKEWTQINHQACGMIRLCLVKELKYFIMKETSAKEL